MLLSHSRHSDYLITFDTLALLPIWEDGKLHTKVLEKKMELIVHQKPLTIIKKSLIHYGSNLPQMISYSKQILGTLHKLPIIVSRDFGMPLIFFPTLSPESTENCWVNFHEIEKMSSAEKRLSYISFSNSRLVKFNSSFSTMCRQFYLSHALNSNYVKEREKWRFASEVQQMYYVPKRMVLKNQKSKKQ